MTQATAAPTPEKRAGIGFIALYILAVFGCYVALITPSVVTVAIRIGQIDPAGKVTSLSLTLGLGAVLAVIANPVFGHLSDRTTSAWGMRRPWIVAGCVGGTLGLLLIAVATTTTMVIVGWCLTQTMFNAMVAALVAILPDQIPARQRGMVSGFLGICFPLSLVVGSYIAQAVADLPPFWMIMIPAAFAPVTAAIICAVLDDRRLSRADRPAFDARELLRTFSFSPRRNPDFGWACLVVFLLSMGASTLTTYLVYYLSDYLHIAADEVPRLAFVVNLISYGVAIPICVLSGWISDRLGKRKFVVFFASTFLPIGMGIVVLTGSLPGLLAGAAVAGVGLGGFYGGHFALPSEVLSGSQDAAREMGVANIALTVPSAIVPIYAPALLAVGDSGQNYPLLFLSGIVLALLAIPVIRRIRGVS